MRAFRLYAAVAALVFAPFAFSQDPYDDSEESRKSWEIYTQKLLRKISEPWGMAPVAVVSGREPSVDVKDHNLIVISSEFFRAVTADDERAAVLAHEMSHRMIRQEPAVLYRWFSPAGYDYKLLEQNEIEADWNSEVLLERAGFDICAAKRALQIYVDGYHMEERPDTPMHRLHLKRLGLLRVHCYNKGKLQDLRPRSLPEPETEVEE